VASVSSLTVMERLRTGPSKSSTAPTWTAEESQSTSHKIAHAVHDLAAADLVRRVKVEGSPPVVASEEAPVDPNAVHVTAVAAASTARVDAVENAVAAVENAVAAHATTTTTIEPGFIPRSRQRDASQVRVNALRAAQAGRSFIARIQLGRAEFWPTDS
jgi:hypothetical protein